MDDPALPPAGVLAVFMEIKRFVDAAVIALQDAADPARQVELSDSASATDALSVTVIPATATARGAAFDATVRTEAPMFTIDQVNIARAWVEMAKSAGYTALWVATFETLIQFAERVLELAK